MPSDASKKSKGRKKTPAARKPATKASNGGGGPRASAGTRRASSEAKLENLLSEAARLIASNGYDNTSIRDVARATGYSLAGMYYYFASKEDLLYQIQRNTFAALLEAQETAVASADSADDQLEAIVQGYLAFYISHTNEMKICTYEFDSLQGELQESLRGMRHRLYELMANIVAELIGCSPKAARDAQTVRHHTMFVYGILNWLFMWFDADRDGPPPRLGDEIVAMIRNGLPVSKRK